jgi:hypothetical protein
MRPEEITAFGDLVGEAAAAGAAQIRELHEGIAARVWSAVGPAAIDGTPVGRGVVGALNGIYGDRIERRGNRLARDPIRRDPQSLFRLRDPQPRP